MDVSSVSSIVTALQSYLTSATSSSSESGTTSGTQSGSETEGSGSTDLVQLSAQAKALAEGAASSVASSFFSSIDASDGISMDELISLMREKTTSLLDYLDNSSDIYGLDNSSQTQFGLDSLGNVNVLNGTGANKSAYESLFSQNNQMSELFQQISSLASTVSASQQALEFREAYEADPQAALEKYSYLFDEGYDPQVSLGYSEGSLQAWLTGQNGTEAQQIVA
ncbi:hypothetical protein LLH00_01670 [bacterium]|nr:hypothetical protein [bacterium]